MVRLLNELININQEIILFIACKGGVYEKNLDPRIKVIYGTRRKKLETNWSLLVSTFKLAQCIKSYQPKIVFSMMDHVNISAILGVKLLKNKPILICGIHNTPSQKYIVNGNGEKKIWFLLMKRFYGYANLIIACSHGVRSDLKKLIPNLTTPIEVIYNAAITDEISAYYEKRPRTLFSDVADIEVKSIITCGRLIKQKGYDLLVQAFALLSKEVNVKLCFIGDGPEKSNLSALCTELGVSKSVTFLGYLDNPFVEISKSDVFVMSSLFEGNPQVIVEAMAVGVPVVSIDCPYGPAEIIENMKNGVLVSSRNPKDLSKAILQLLNNGELRANISKNAIISARSRHAKEIAIQHNELFLKMMDK